LTVTAVRKDPDSLALTMDAEFDAAAERVWQLWADPRQLQRWWGPSTHASTVDSFNLLAGGRVEYHMTGPDGDQPKGYWDIVEADAPRRLVYQDSFRNEDGSLNTAFPVIEGQVTIEEVGTDRTRMSIRIIFPNVQAMEQELAMGMEDGLTQAVGQIDALLAEEVTVRA
jgi:uncharacterized protein YndB with AHSA1/START domain